MKTAQEPGLRERRLTTVMQARRLRSLGFVVALAAAFLLFAPVNANYIERAEYDVIDYRTASCGTPILSVLGAEPGLGGGSPYPVGAVNAQRACKGAAGGRVTIALSILLDLSLALWFTTRRTSARVRSTPSI